jgi:hypothetical protein
MSKTGGAPWDKKVAARGEMIAIESPDDPRLFEPKLLLCDTDGEVATEDEALCVTISRGKTKEYKIRVGNLAAPQAVDPYAEGYTKPSDYPFLFVNSNIHELYNNYIMMGSKRLLKQVNKEIRNG